MTALRDDLLYWRKPPGYAEMAAIVRAYDTGKPLPDEALKRLVDALRVFTADGSADSQLQEFGRRARLRTPGDRGKGRPEPTANDAERREAMVIEVFQLERRLISEGTTKKQARTLATCEIAANRHCGVRTLQENIVKFGDSARTTLRVLDYAHEYQAEQRRLADAARDLRTKKRTLPGGGRKSRPRG